MRTVQPSIAGLIRSDAQGKVLAQVLVMAPERGISMTDVARATDLPLTTVHREVQRLVGSDILLDERVGRTRILRPNPDNPIVVPLTQILTLTYGPLPLLSAALSELDGLEEAWIYGSWAARMSGEPGPFPADIDVLLVGEVGRLDAFAATAGVEERLARPVNPTVVTPARWADLSDPFVATLRSRAAIRIPLAGEGA